MPSRWVLAELRGATLETRLKAMGVLRLAAFVDYYNHRHRHSDIKYVTPHQRQSGTATAFGSNELMTTRRPARLIQEAEADPLAAGINPKK